MHETTNFCLTHKTITYRSIWIFLYDNHCSWNPTRVVFTWSPASPAQNLMTSLSWSAPSVTWCIMEMRRLWSRRQGLDVTFSKLGLNRDLISGKAGNTLILLQWSNHIYLQTCKVSPDATNHRLHTWITPIGFLFGHADCRFRCPWPWPLTHGNVLQTFHSYRVWIKHTGDAANVEENLNCQFIRMSSVYVGEWKLVNAP